jgi:hypothetical protein
MRYLLILLIFLTGCKSDPFYAEFKDHFIPKELPNTVGCGTEDQDIEFYRLAELFFKNNETLTFKIRAVVLLNGAPKFTPEVLSKRMEAVNDFFADSKSGIQFALDTTIFIEGTPEEKESSLRHIQLLEELALSGKRDRSLRESYKMVHYKFWDRLYGSDEALTLYIYNDGDAPVAGIAGGIGATFCAVSLTYFHQQFRVIEHELGHCLGLFHTHQSDPSTVDNAYHGDKLASTPKSPSLSGLINDNCELADNWETIQNKSDNDLKIIHKLNKQELELLIRNVMSYTKGRCRVEFHESQVLRMRKIIETSADLRKRIQGLENTYSDYLWGEFVTNGQEY